MANNVFSPEQIQEATKLWSMLTQQVSDSVKVLSDYRAEAQKLPSAYIANLNKIKDSQNALNTSITKTKTVQSQLTATQKESERQEKRNTTLKARLNKSTSQQSKENAKLNEQLKELNKQNRQEAKALIEVQGEYNKIQQRVNALTRQYNDLAIRKELNGDLNTEEIISLGKLEAELNQYQTALRNVDARIQKHTRNVGNYRSGFDGLGVSVAQITRELPAFTNSLQTGFLAVSNNIPILVDEINRLKAANVELTASGKPTVNIFKQVGKAVFTWQS